MVTICIFSWELLLFPLNINSIFSMISCIYLIFERHITSTSLIYMYNANEWEDILDKTKEMTKTKCEKSLFL